MSENNETGLVPVASPAQMERTAKWGSVGVKWALWVWNANPDRFVPQIVFRFENGYGASVIPDIGHKTLVELAVLHFDAQNEWHLNYDTPITCDVLRLTIPELDETLQGIRDLPPYPGTMLDVGGNAPQLEG